MAFETTEQFQAAMIESQRATMLILADIRDCTVALKAWVEGGGFGAPPTKNGQAAQLPLGASSNGHAPAAPEVDELGNPRVKCVRYDCKVTPMYIVRVTRKSDHERLYVSVPVDDYGAGDAHRYACIALRCFKGVDLAKNLDLLPKRIRRRVEDVLGL